MGNKLTESSATFEELDPIFGELMRYSQYHFKHEEQIMYGSNVDARHIKDHINAHKNFIQDIGKQYSSMDREQIIASAKRLLDFLVQWLTFHILGMDKALTAQIRLIEAGYKPEDAYTEINGVNHEQIGTLVNSFNGIFGVLMKYNEELLTLKKSLEDQVAERTKELAEANQHLVELNKRLEVIAMTDHLTGIANRHRTMVELNECWQEFKTKAIPCSIIMLDIDNFKGINDTCGHDSGDVVLAEFARTITFSVRTDDIVCRLGGDEFIVICPNTAMDGASNLADKIYENIQKIDLKFKNGSWKGSSSIGVASACESMYYKEELLKAADRALYVAKANGKNQISIAQ